MRERESSKEDKNNKQDKIKDLDEEIKLINEARESLNLPENTSKSETRRKFDELMDIEYLKEEEMEKLRHDLREKYKDWKDEDIDSYLKLQEQDKYLEYVAHVKLYGQDLGKKHPTFAWFMGLLDKSYEKIKGFFKKER